MDGWRARAVMDGGVELGWMEGWSWDGWRDRAGISGGLELG